MSNTVVQTPVYQPVLTRHTIEIIADWHRLENAHFVPFGTACLACQTELLFEIGTMIDPFCPECES